MRHYPATRHPARLEGVTVTRAPRAFSIAFLVLAGAALFAAGFVSAVWTVGMIITAR